MRSQERDQRKEEKPALSTIPQAPREVLGEKVGK